MIDAWYSGKRIAITGGTGSVGQAIAAQLLTASEPVSELLIFSRDEQKQFEMAQSYPGRQFPVRYVLGDVRNLARLSECLSGMDGVIHSAAMKHVPAAEYNPMECIMTNILGSQNIIAASREHGVKRVVALSTDKAVSPINTYGATKLLLEKLFVHAQQSAEGGQKFSVVRFGNIFGSKGSVVPFFQKLAEEQQFLPVTDTRMTRFSLTMKEAVDMVLFALEHIYGGELILPDAPSYRLVDVAQAIAPTLEHRSVGMRPGERLHEPMFSDEEANRVSRRSSYFVVAPEHGDWCAKSYCEHTGAKPLKEKVGYDSNANNNWLSVENIRALVQQ